MSVSNLRKHYSKIFKVISSLMAFGMIGITLPNTTRAETVEYEPHEGAALVGGAASSTPGNVSSNGDISYAIPLGGVTAVYSTRTGWIVGGVSAVSRSTKWGVPQYTDEDIFMLNGTELASEFSGSNRYHMKREGYNRIIYKDRETANSHWEVTDSKGTKTLYGNSGNSRVVEQGGDIHPRLWAMTEIRDAANNNITRYVYDTHRAGEYIYPTKIISGKTAATGNEYKATLIYYEDKPYSRTSYIEGLRVVDAKRVKSVVDVIGCDMYGNGGHAISAFKINWALSPYTKMSLISSIVPYGNDVVWNCITGDIMSGTTLPATTFEYPDQTEIPLGFESNPKQWPIDGPCYLGLFESRALVGGQTVHMPRFWTMALLRDINGDGLPDFISPGFRTGFNMVRRNQNGSGFSTFEEAYMPFSEGCLNWSETVIDWETDFWGIRHFYDGRLSTHSDLIDMNGDGLLDHAFQKNGDMEIHWYGEEAGGAITFAGSSQWPSPGAPAVLRKTRDVNYQRVPGTYYVDFLDMNGDQLPDKVFELGGRIKASLNTGIGFTNVYDFGNDSLGGELPMKDLRDLYFYREGNKNHQYTRQDIMDINGDGLPDKIGGGGRNHAVRFNDGHQWEQSISLWPTSSVPESMPYYVRASISDSHDKHEAHATRTHLDFADINGDGLIDKLFWSASTSKLYVFFNEGSGFGEPRFLGTEPYGISYTWTDRADSNGARNSYQEHQLLDMNGDGLPDKVHITSNSVQVYLNKMHSTAGHLLKKVSLGSGGTIEYDYARLSRANHPDYSVPGWVISSITRDGGFSSSEITTYEYNNGRYDPRTKEDRGFGIITRTDTAGNHTDTYYRQDDAAAGLVEKIIKRDSAGNIYKYTYNTYKDLAETNTTQYGYGVTQNRPLAGPDVLVRSPMLIQQDTYLCDGTIRNDLGNRPGGSDANFKRLRTRYEYTKYGEIAVLYEDGLVAADGSDIGADRRRTNYNYAHQDVTWVTVPSMKEVRGTDGLSNTFQHHLTTRKLYYYDGENFLGDVMPFGQVWYGQLKAITHLDGTTIKEVAYDEYGNVNRVRDANGGISTSIYDATYHAQLASHTNPKNFTENYAYDERMQLTGVQDVNGVWTHYEYDLFGRRNKVIKPGDSSQFPSEWVVYHDDAWPQYVETRVRELAGQPGTVDVFTYRDGFGRLIQTKKEGVDDQTGSDAWITTDVWSYVDEGKAITETTIPYYTSQSTYSRASPPPNDTMIRRSYLYPHIGRVEEVTNPDGTIRTTYHRPLKIEYIDENLYGFSEIQDGLGRTVERHIYSDKYNAGGFETLYRRDSFYYSSASGNLLKRIEDVDGIAVSWSAQYDSQGRMILEDDADRGVRTYTYDDNGNVLSRTNAKDQTLTWTYDELNRVMSKSFPDGSIVTYTYDDDLDIGKSNHAIGRLTKVTDVSGETIFSYDSRGRVEVEGKSIEGLNGVPLFTHYSYDSMDRVRTINYPPDGEIVVNTYDAAGALVSVGNQDDPQRYVSKIVYNAMGLEINRELGNGVSEMRQYGDARDNFRLTHLGVRDRSDQVIFGASYDYDFVGNITEIDAEVDSNRSLSFTYDHMNRLEAQTNRDFVGGLASFEYDRTDNIITKSTNGIGVGYEYDADKPHAVVQTSDGGAFIYDLTGNMVSKTVPGLPHTPDVPDVPDLETTLFDVVKGQAGSFDTNVSNSFAIVKLDANGDGIMDLAVANNFQPNELHLGKGDGTFTKIDAGEFDHEGGFVQSGTIVALDAEGDGDTDLVIGGYTEPNELYMNDGSGCFTKVECGDFDNLGHHTMALAAVDVNGDGHTDLVEGTYYGNYVYANNGSGMFSLIEAGDFDNNDGPIFAMAAADMDNDGDVDLVTGHETDDIRLYRNNGSGVFYQVGHFYRYGESCKPEDFVLMDVNNDNILDVLVGSYGYPNRLYLGDENLVFVKAEAGDFDDEAQFTRDLTAADFDQDGDLDLVVGNFASPRRVYRNMGGGSFVKVDTPALERDLQYTYEAATLDANSDGYPDIAFANNQSVNQIFLLDGQSTDVLSNDTVIVRVAGSAADGWPIMEVYADDELLGTWTVDHTDFRDYVVTRPLYELSMNKAHIYVGFTNDTYLPDSLQDRNLFVDYIEVNGIRMESEAIQVDYIVDISRDSTDIIGGQEAMFWSGWLKFPVPTGIAASWSFNENGGFTAGDSSGGDGTLELHGGATWVEGMSGSAVYFDGVDDYATMDEITGLPAGNDPYTIEAWIKPDSMGNRGIVGWGQYYALNKVNCFRLSPWGLVNYWWSNDLTIPTYNMVGNWHHVAATYDGTTRSIYLDGEIVASDTPSGHDVSLENFTVGKTFESEFFHGVIDELSIWKRAMSANEVAHRRDNPPVTWEYTYDTDSRLTHIEGPVSADYMYDYTGRRVSKTENGIPSYYYSPYYEKEIQGPVKSYYANGSLVASEKGGSLTFFHQDHQGNSALMTDANGFEIKNIVYMPYGSDAEVSGTGDEPKYRYTGQERDQTGLYYYGARFYDSDLGRFLSVDPMGDDYCYVGNNPIMRTDPTGEFPVLAAVGMLYTMYNFPRMVHTYGYEGFWMSGISMLSGGLGLAGVDLGLIGSVIESGLQYTLSVSANGGQPWRGDEFMSSVLQRVAFTTLAGAIKDALSSAGSTSDSLSAKAETTEREFNAYLESVAQEFGEPQPDHMQASLKGKIYVNFSASDVSLEAQYNGDGANVLLKTPVTRTTLTGEDMGLTKLQLPLGDLGSIYSDPRADYFTITGKVPILQLKYGGVGLSIGFKMSDNFPKIFNPWVFSPPVAAFVLGIRGQIQYAP